MALKAAMVLAGISIVLLVLYGADVAVSMGNTDNEGFLPLNDMQRGMGLGGPAIILPIIAFFIALKEKSKGFFDIAQIISRSPYPRNIKGVSYNPEQVSKMPEFLELLIRWIREQNGENVNMLLTRLTKIAEKFIR